VIAQPVGGFPCQRFSSLLGDEAGQFRNQQSRNSGQLQNQDKPEAAMMQPALRQIGTTPRPVRRAKIAVFLTGPIVPFVNCGLCSARIFFNG
jgi:hypothetical protein